MNFFNIGTAELMLIFVIALIVVGPRRLPEVGRTLGKAVNDVRQMSQELTAPLTQELSMPVEVNETKEMAEQSVSEKASSEDRG
jgi:Tat protein translocase TatB subunit